MTSAIRPLPLSGPQVGLKLETAEFSVLGTCKKLTISKDDTIMLDGAGEKDAIEERCELLRDSIADTSSEYEKEKLQACDTRARVASRLLSHPIPSRPIPSPHHPIPSHPVPSHPVPSPFHPIPSHPVPSQLIPSHPNAPGHNPI